MHPSEDRESKFTCYALSEDGTLLATGESSGRIRLWDASNFSRRDEFGDLFTQCVRCLSFLDGSTDNLVAVGDAGVVKVFPLQQRASGASSKRAVFFVPEDQTTSKYLPRFGDASNSAETWEWQVSKNGRTIVVAVGRDRNRVFWAYRIEGMGAISVKLLELSYGRHELTAPLLSSNGQSVMSFVWGQKQQTVSTAAGGPQTQDVETQIVVWPTLQFTHAVIDIPPPSDSDRKTPPVVLDGVLATWGRGGEYLLLWTGAESGRRPALQIYKTRELTPQCSRAYATRTLDCGLLTWDAQILDSVSDDQNLIVALYETFDLSRRRLLLWDAHSDVVRTEVHVPMPAKCLNAFSEDEMAKWKFSDGMLDQLLESGTVECQRDRSSHGRAVEDILHPKFAITSDLAIAAFFSWRFETVVIVSLSTGGMLWRCTLPSLKKTNPFSQINTCRFNKSEHRLMVVGEEKILAFAPSCLEVRPRHRTRYQASLQDADPVSGIWRSCLANFHHLPGIGLRSCFLDFPMEASMSEQTTQMPQCCNAAPRIVDAAVSAGGDRVVFITERGGNYEIFASNKLLNSEPQKEHEEVTCPEGLHSVKPPGTDSINYCPEYVFLHSAAQDNSDVLLIVGTVSDIFFARFYYFSSEEWHAPNTESSPELEPPWLSYAQTVGGRKILLLDIQNVHIFDLETRDWTAIRYRSSFKTTMAESVKYEKYWLPLNHHRKISDDGKHVLIGWDRHKRAGIVVTDQMTDSDVQSMILMEDGSGAAKNICFDCAISHDGEWIAYADLDKHRRLIISIYKIATKETTHRLPVDIPPDIKPMGSVFFSFSANGEEIVIARPSDQRSPCRTILVTPYATDECLPDHHCLKTTAQSMVRKSRISLREMYNKHGVGICNMLNIAGVSLFEAALLEKDNWMVQEVQEIAEAEGFKLSMKFVQKSEELQHAQSSSALRSQCFCRRSLANRDGSRDLMALLCKRLFPFQHSAAILKNVFIEAWLNYPGLIEDIFSNNRLIVDTCTLRVHRDFFSGKDHLGVHVETADTIMEWSLLQEDRRHLAWRDHHRELVDRMEEGGDATTVSATLKVVRLEDIAQIGMKGILRRLLLQDVPDYFYKYDIVKWTILLKWKTFWEKRCRRQMMWYTSFVLLFSFYAAWIGSQTSLQDCKMSDLLAEIVLLLFCWFYALWMFYEECLQIWSLMADGKDHFKSRRRGLKIYFDSKWNWVQLASCMIVVILVPVLRILAYFHSAFDSTLAVFVGFEAVLVWFKIWYHAQALRKVGPLVLMIGNIVRESFYFLCLALMILIGFSLALHVMFNHLPDGAITKDNREHADRIFGTFPNSILTLFYALFANFEPELFLLVTITSVPITLTFVAYVLMETLLLLNLLIAIMGDTFDKVRSREESQVLKGRAKYIDAGEAALSPRRGKEDERRIRKYLMVLVNDEDETTRDNRGERGEWGGKIEAIREIIQTTLRKRDEQQRAEVDELKNAIQILERRHLRAHRSLRRSRSVCYKRSRLRHERPKSAELMSEAQGRLSGTP